MLHHSRITFEVDRGRSTGITGKEPLASVGCDRIASAFDHSQLLPQSVMAHPVPTQSEAHALDAHAQTGRALASSTARAPSLSCYTLRRQSSAIRTGCANERPSGSVRGAVSNDRPYRDPTTCLLTGCCGRCSHQPASWPLEEIGATMRDQMDSADESATVTCTRRVIMFHYREQANDLPASRRCIWNVRGCFCVWSRLSSHLHQAFANGCDHSLYACFRPACRNSVARRGLRSNVLFPAAPQQDVVGIRRSGVRRWIPDLCALA